jgi:protein-S-isoprenylcysteine O-methyltransferase Ste14
MPGWKWDRPGLLKLAAGLVLAAGLLSAWLIYQGAQEEERRLLAQQESGGNFQQVVPQHSKRFLHDLEVYGGKANVLMYKFQVWLAELWQGRSLAGMVAGCALVVGGALLWAARRKPGPWPPDQEGPGKGGGAG